ncbi:hypothetical protein MHTCC0001_17780 [Flavobacteriaceae bacterium MHTCC 0001]
MKTTISLLIIIVLNQNYFDQKQFEFEKLLGKDTSDFEECIGNDFENKIFQDNFYYVEDEHIKKDYFGMKFNMLFITNSS